MNVATAICLHPVGRKANPRSQRGRRSPHPRKSRRITSNKQPKRNTKMEEEMPSLSTISLRRRCVLSPPTKGALLKIPTLSKHSSTLKTIRGR